MRKVALYSSSRRSQPLISGVPDGSSHGHAATTVEPPREPNDRPAIPLLRRLSVRWVIALIALVCLALALGWRWGGGFLSGKSPGQSLSMRLIEDRVRRSLEEEPLVPRSVTASKLIAPSVVRVVGLMNDHDIVEIPSFASPSLGAGDNKNGHESGVGTGVVIIDNGTILTNLHVLQGAKRIRVTFSDGHVSDALLASTDRRNDLAVLRALSVPDDLQAAVIRSTADLAPGEPVMAVGFPFGIGPSFSLGVVSGLKREFRSHDGERVMTNLIQFDAAANPGNSGGPLITMDGAVVGIVTAILNPAEQGVFIGIGFAVPIENAAAAAGMPPF